MVCSRFLTPVRHKVFSPIYIAPITDPKRLALMIEKGETEKLAHLPVLPATTKDSSSIYNEPMVRSVILYYSISPFINRLVIGNVKLVGIGLIDRIRKRTDTVQGNGTW